MRCIGQFNDGLGSKAQVQYKWLAPVLSTKKFYLTNVPYPGFHKLVLWFLLRRRIGDWWYNYNYLVCFDPSVFHKYFPMLFPYVCQFLLHVWLFTGKDDMPSRPFISLLFCRAHHSSFKVPVLQYTFYFQYLSITDNYICSKANTILVHLKSNEHTYSNINMSFQSCAECLGPYQYDALSVYDEHRTAHDMIIEQSKVRNWRFS